MCEHFCPMCRDEWSHDIEEECDSRYEKPCPQCRKDRGDEYD